MQRKSSNVPLAYLLRWRFIHFSGADRSILNKIPADDRKSYWWIAMYNILISLVQASVLFILLKHHSTLSYNSTFIISFYSFCLLLIFQIRLTRKLINTWSQTGQFFYFFWIGIIILLLILFLWIDIYEHSEFNLIYRINLAVSTICILLLFVLCFLGIKQSQNDFYHQLLNQKFALNNDLLQKQRQKIIEEFRIQEEISNTKASLGQINAQSELEKKEITKILSGLQDNLSPTTLMNAADFENKQGRFQKALEYVNKAIELDFENADLWFRKSELLIKLNRLKEGEDARRLYSEFFEKSNFDKNLKKEIGLYEAELKNIPFYGSFVWKFKKGINLLLGKNGYGKSHLMSIILAQLQEESSILIDFTKIKSAFAGESTFIQLTLASNWPIDWEKIDEAEQHIELLNKKIEEFKSGGKQVLPDAPTHAHLKMTDLEEYQEEVHHLTQKINDEMGTSLFEKSGGIKSTYGKIPVLAIPDSRFINKSTSFTLPVIDDKSKKILEFGAYHFIQQLPFENVIQNFLNTVGTFYNENKNFDDAIFALINRVFKRLSNQDFIWHEISHTEDRSGYIIKVLTEGNSEPLPIQKVSQGTLSILAMVGLIFHYLKLRYPDITGNELVKKHAVIFIDEIDAHLHPGWQQKIIGILRDEFPGIQFIISAHSPLVVAGCLDGEVSVLRQSEDGFKLHQFKENFIGLTVAEIFAKVFETEDRDEQYLKYSLYSEKSIQQLKEQRDSLMVRQDENKISKSEENELAGIICELHYIDSAKNNIDKRAHYPFIESENEMLKSELQRLTTDIDELKAENTELKNTITR